MKFKSKTRCRGEYSIKILDEHGNERKKTGNIKNLLVDRFFTEANSGQYLIGNGYNHPMGRIVVGTGTTEPTVSDTSLENQIAQKNVSSTPTCVWSAESSEHTLTGTIEKVFSFSLGEVVGNLTEVGLLSSRSPYSMVARSLIKDALGNPTVLTLTSQDQLVITYRIIYEDFPTRSYSTLNITDKNGNITDTVDCEARIVGTLQSTNSDVTQMPHAFGYGGYFFGAGGSSGFGMANLASEPSNWEYGKNAPIGASSSKRGSISFPTPPGDSFPVRVAWGIDNGNVDGGFNFIWIGLYSSTPGFTFYFSKTIPKTSSDIMVIDFSMQYSRG